MANKSAFVSVLRAMRNSAHSISKDELATATGLSSTVIGDVISELLRTETIKENRDNLGTFFTRKPKRNAIGSFIASPGSQLGVDFTDDAPAATAPAPVAAEATTPEPTSNVVEVEYVETMEGDVNDFDVRTILQAIKDAPSAISADELLKVMNGDGALMNAIVNVLIDDELIKEHVEKPDHFFTRKPMRAKIDAFLAGGKLSELLSDDFVIRTCKVDRTPKPEADVTTDSTPDKVEAKVEAKDEAVRPRISLNFVDAGAINESDLVDLLIGQRAIINILLTRLGQ